ncbi:hypothetical protein DESACE_07225 [Desulfurella acetivorans A63]|nr:hypothetical protein DESACE_07225 [Desulfurella acetivorans A63]
MYFNFKDIGAKPIDYDFSVNYNINNELLKKISNCNAIAVCDLKIAEALIKFFQDKEMDIRLLPTLITNSSEVFDFFKKYCLQSIKKIDSIRQLEICYVYNYNSNNGFIKKLSKLNNIIKIKLQGCVYKQHELPPFDIIYFNNTEQFFYFKDIYGISSLKNKIVLANDKDLNNFFNHKKQFYQFSSKDFKQIIANLLNLL